MVFFQTLIIFFVLYEADFVYIPVFWGILCKCPNQSQTPCGHAGE